MGLGCPQCCFSPPAPLQLSPMAAVHQSIPWDTHSEISVMSKSCLSRKKLQPGKIGNSYHKESLLKSKPSPSGKWGVLRPPTFPPWTTQGCSQALPEQPDPCTLYMPYRISPWADQGGTENGKRIRKENYFIFFSNKINSKITEAFPCLVRS